MILRRPPVPAAVRNAIATSVVTAEGQRLLLYSMIVGERIERAEEYLMLLDLEGLLTKGQRRSRVTSLRREEKTSESRSSSDGGRELYVEQSVVSDSDPHPIDGFEENFSW
jgi:hypothetical protein